MGRASRPWASLAAGLMLAGCGDTGRVAAGLGGAVVSGVATVGSLAVSTATTVGGAGLAAAGILVGAGVEVVGATASAVAGAVASSPATAPAASAGAPAAPAEAAAAALLVDPSGGGAGEAAAVALGSVGATLVGLRLLDAAGSEAVPQAEELLRRDRAPADRCALRVFLGVAGAAGHAQGARFVAWFGDRVRERGEAEALAGTLAVADQVVQTVRDAADRAQIEAAGLLGFEDPATLRDAIGIARDVQGRCPAEAARQVAAFLEEERPAED